MATQILATLGMSYENFVRFYLNKKNPDTGMYWQMDAMATATGTPLAVLTGYLYRAQQKNYEIVASTGKSATVDQLLADELAAARLLTKAQVKAQAKGE